MDFNPSHHALLTMISRCLSGQWFIEPDWLLQHADLILQADKGEDMTKRWPKMQSELMVSRDGLFAAAGQADTIGKGQALGVINMIGPVYKYSSYYTPTSSKSLVSLLKSLEADDRVGGVKLIVDSPGGMVHGTREVYQTILNYSKSILVSVDGYCASAAYYMASPADRIVATQPNDQIGSIGTYVTLADWTAYYASLGVNIYEIYAKASSEKNEAARQLFDSKGKESDLMQKQITAYNDLFISDVKAGRGDRLTGKGQDPLKGRIFQTAGSIENGLIDELISDSETLSLLSDMIVTKQQSSIQMSSISKIKAAILGAFASIEADENPANPAAELPSIEQLQSTISQLTTERDSKVQELTALKTEKDALATEKATLVTEKSSLEAKVAELGEQPGAMGTQSKKKDSDDLNDNQGNDWLSKVAGLEHNKAADELFS